jgi:hypothetical protein
MWRESGLRCSERKQHTQARLMYFICKHIVSVTFPVCNNNDTLLLFIFTPMLEPSTLLVMQQESKAQLISMLFNWLIKVNCLAYQIQVCLTFSNYCSPNILSALFVLCAAAFMSTAEHCVIHISPSPNHFVSNFRVSLHWCSPAHPHAQNNSSSWTL